MQTPPSLLSQWRDELLSAILLIALVLGTITAIPSALLAMREKLWSIVLVDTLAIIWVTLLWRMRTISFTTRAWNLLLIVYLIGVFFIFKVGLVSQIYLMAVPVLTALLLGLRPAIYTLILNALTLLILGYFYPIDTDSVNGNEKLFLRSFIITLNFTFICSVITVTCGVLLRRLEESLSTQIAISFSLEQEQASLTIANEELRLTSAALANLNDIVMITDTDSNNDGPHIVFVNQAFERNTGYSREDVIGLNPRLLQGEVCQENAFTVINGSITVRASVREEGMHYRKNGDMFWMELDIQPILNSAGYCTNFVAVGRDITDRKKSELDIYRLAFLDALTGLPNRKLLQDRMAVMLAKAQRTTAFSAVLFIDLDHFKTINDARGHAVGDRLLIEVALRLSSLLREVDTVARIGGDEFVVLLDSLAEQREVAGMLALGVAEKIRAALEQEFFLESQAYASGCSIGVTLTQKQNQSCDDLLRESDTAMYRAKAAGRNQIIFFEDSMQVEVEQRLRMVHGLAKALDLGELQMLMQSQVNPAGIPVGAELLMRWTSLDIGPISPAVFIPLAEETGLIVRMGDWVLKQACQMLKQLRLEGWRFPLSINVSPKQFKQKDFVEKVQEILTVYEVDGSCLIFEVTEGLFIDNLPDIISRMKRLASLGVRFSIDDFGTGYSSLYYLKRLPLYELKIDKSFVQDIPKDPDDTAIVRSILAMAKHLGLRVVAEGVETQEQANFLEQCGCDSLQGFLFSRPSPLDVWLSRQSRT
ncbi:MAG: EAL domain-containing protein [Undibacterium sp.]|nr:EAL domain-containing protein [Undibacterium sp.]